MKNKFPSSKLARILAEEGLVKNSSFKTAGEDPVLVSKRDILEGRGFMTYRVDAENNNSKFYEVLIQEQPDGTWAYLPRWGALTDKGRPGRIDGQKSDKFGLSFAQAFKMLQAQYNKRLQRGYTDASKHSGLQKFKYPVGLSRRPGFGWGVQSITSCVPQLRGMLELIDMSLAEVRADEPLELLGHLESLSEILRGLENSDMAVNVSKLIRPAIERMRQNPRFILDPARTVKDLQKVRLYLNKQLSLCNV